MKNIAIALSCLFVLSSCRTITGNLEVLESFSLKTKKGEVKLSEGTQVAKIKVNSKRSVTLKVNGEKVKLKLAKGNSFPANGEFDYNTTVTGQDVAVSGEVTKEVTLGDRRTYVETCYESFPLTRCYNGFCERVYRRVYGTRRVVYQDKTVEEIVNVNFEKEDAVVAKFNANNVSRTSSLVDYGFCNAPRVGGYYRGRWHYRY